MENQLNLNDIKPVEQSGLDLWQFDKKEIEIESAEVTQVKSQFVDTKEKQQWVLKVFSKPVISIGEGDDKIEFRASELFNLVQDAEGKLKGFPTSDGSSLMKFLKDIRVENADKAKSLKDIVDVMVSKKALIKCYDKIKDGKKSTFLKFRY